MKNQLKEDLNDFLKEKEELREVIGKIGGNNNTQAKIITTLFMGIVLVIFVTGIILKQLSPMTTLLLLLLIISFKIIWMLQQMQKSMHFQFWVLNSIEIRINELDKRQKKIEKILEYGADITVVTENVVEEKLLKLENVKIENNQKIENDKAKIEKLVKGYFLVIAATDNEELNENIANVCDSNGMLINNVSSKVKMNAMFGGIVKNDEFQIAVSTGGKNCRRSRAMKSEIQKILDKIEK